MLGQTTDLYFGQWTNAALENFSLSLSLSLWYVILSECYKP